MSNDLITETYLTNLLGHLDVARGTVNVNPDRGREYAVAERQGHGRDAYDSFAHTAAMDVLKATAGWNSPWPKRFHELRTELDQAFAPDPAAEEPAEVPAGPQHVLAMLRDGILERTWDRLGAPGPLFDDVRLKALADRWEVPATRPAVVTRAPAKIGWDDDLMDWFVDTLLTDTAQAALHEVSEGDLAAALRLRFVAPAAAVADERYFDGIEFGYGQIDSLSYAALDGWLRRMLTLVTRCAQEALDRAAHVLPDAQGVLARRLVAAVELERNYLNVVNLLFGPVAASPVAVALDAILAAARGDQEETVPPPPCLADWLVPASPVQCRWGKAASRIHNYLVAVEVVGATPKRLLRPSVPRHVLVRDTSDNELVARLEGLTAAQEGLINQYLTGAVAAADGSLMDRLRRAPLGPPPPDPTPTADPGQAGTPAVAHLDPDSRLLLARALEVLNPRMPARPDVISEFDDLKVKPWLPAGDTVFECEFKSVADLAAHLASG